MILNLEHIGQLFISTYHACCRFEAVIGDLLCRRQNQMLFILAPAKDQRGKHNSGGDRRFCVFFRDQQTIFADKLITRLGVVSSEYHFYKIEDPVFRTLPKSWLTREISNPQFTENAQCLLRLISVNRRRDNGLACNQTRFPVRTSRRPLRHRLPLIVNDEFWRCHCSKLAFASSYFCCSISGIFFSCFSLFGMDVRKHGLCCILSDVNFFS